MSDTTKPWIQMCEERDRRIAELEAEIVDAFLSRPRAVTESVRELREALKQAAENIDEAAHSSDCELTQGYMKPGSCDCWKAKALAAIREVLK